MYRALFSLLVIGTVAVAGVPSSSSNIDAAQRFTWGENVGWINWRGDVPTIGDGVIVALDHLSGFAWAENVGWINMGNGGGPYVNDLSDSSTFGVNIDPVTGELFGKAWGENIGWVNFDTAVLGGDRARFSACDRLFSGYVWAENVGWINLDDAIHYVSVGPCASGDLDCDGGVMLDDYPGFTASLDGPGVTATCSVFDTDADNDVDLNDYAEMQRVFTAAP